MSLLRNTIRTIGLEIKDTIILFGIQIGGIATIILGSLLFVSNKKALGISGILIFIGVVLLVIASYMQKKVRFIAWVREAIEIERNRFSKKCPRCNNMNISSSNYCSHCANRI